MKFYIKYTKENVEEIINLLYSEGRSHQSLSKSEFISRLKSQYLDGYCVSYNSDRNSFGWNHISYYLERKGEFKERILEPNKNEVRMKKYRMLSRRELQDKHKDLLLSYGMGKGYQLEEAETIFEVGDIKELNNGTGWKNDSTDINGNLLDEFVSFRSTIYGSYPIEFFEEIVEEKEYLEDDEAWVDSTVVEDIVKETKKSRLGVGIGIGIIIGVVGTLIINKG